MKPSMFVSIVLLALGVALGSAGCSTYGGSSASTTRVPRSFALAVTVVGGGQPTPQQWAVVQSAFRRELAQLGYVLVDDLAQADRIIRVEFIPDIDDPSTGHATVLSVRPNTSYAYAGSRMNTAPTFAFGFSSFTDPSRYYNGLYGYNDPYYNGSYSYTPPTTTPPVTRPPHNRPNNPVDCPPGSERPPGTFAGIHPHHPTPSSPSYGSGSYRSDSSSSSSFSSSSYSSSFDSSPSYSSAVAPSSYSAESAPASSSSHDASPGR
jgi:hypothetical protein